MGGNSIGTLRYALPRELGDAVDASLSDWLGDEKVRRLWARDASLWTNADEQKWLGWLEVTSASRAALADLNTLARQLNALMSSLRRRVGG